MEVIHPNAAGIDVGSARLYGAVADGPVRVFDSSRRRCTPCGIIW